MENSLGNALKEMVEGSKLVLQGELKIARAEVRDSLRTAGRSGIGFGIAAFLGVLSSFSLLAFLIFGLGRLLGDNYWLSSLLVGVVMLGGATGIALTALNRLKKHNFKMTRLANSIRHESRVLNEGLHAVSVAVRGEVEQLKGKIHERAS